MKQKKQSQDSAFFVGWKVGFEPTTLGTTIRYSNQLSYIHHLIAAAKIELFSMRKHFLKKIFFAATLSV